MQGVGHIGGAQPLERGDQVLRALPVLLQREAAHRRPVHRQRLALAAQRPAAPLADEVLVDLPVAAGGQLLDGHVQDGDLLAFLAMAVHQPHPPVEELAEDEPFGGPLFEAAHVDHTGGDDLAGLHAGHPGHRQEDPPPADHLDDQTQDAWRPSADPQHRHQVPDPADLVPVRIEHGHPGEMRDEDPGGSCRHVPPPSPCFFALLCDRLRDQRVSPYADSRTPGSG